MKNEDFLKSMNIANSEEISEKDMSNVVEFQDDKWQFHLDSVVMGYPDLESQANGYFNGGDSFGQDALGANLYKLSDNLFIVEEEDYDDKGILTVFDDETKAKEYLYKQENILYPSIETEIENFLENLDPEKVVYDINSFIKMQNEMKENEYLSLELVSCEQLSKSEYLSVYKIEIEDMITGQIYESTNEVDRVHSPSEKAVGTAIHELWDDIEKDREAEKQKSDTRGR